MTREKVSRKASHTAANKAFAALEVEIVKRSAAAKGLLVLPMRWIVERTIAWRNRCRRLAKGWEGLDRKALSCIHLASIRLMLRNYATRSELFGQNSQPRVRQYRNLSTVLRIYFA